MNRERLSLSQIIRTFPGRIGVTCTLVMIEIVLLAFVPLLIGLAIDGLLAGRSRELVWFGSALVALTVVMVTRRAFDTRAYGSIRVLLGAALDRRFPHLSVSAKSARLGMARELVDFLEQDLPTLLTSVIQILVTLAVLATFDLRLAVSAMVVTVAMIVVYAFSHGRFFRLNASLNSQMERQVTLLEEGRRTRIFGHLRKLRDLEVKLSDTEALVYGSIFLLQIGFIVFNLWISASLPEISAGRIFSIVTYSWEYVEAATMLPVSLQTWSRLAEITRRINQSATEA
ncbi:MAG: ABC transporter six-transmembrane domain-containing protein [Acidobacteriota bacterium]